MAAIPGTPTQFYVQSANTQILASWALSAGADSYIVQRSEDNVTYSTLATISGSPLATQYLDTSAVLATQYWYKVAASSASGTSPYTQPQSEIASPTGEMPLSRLRLRAQQRADRVNSNFVTKPEWNQFINLAAQELDDLLVTIYEDYRVAIPAQFLTDGTSSSFPLPNGSNTFLNGNNLTQTFTPEPFYKLLGVDLQAQNTIGTYVTLRKFNLLERNKYFYPNTPATPYSYINLQYRVLDSKIHFIPTPSANQGIRLWYVPRLKELLLDTDTTVDGMNGWLQYVIVRAAKYALDKEESDTTPLNQELGFLKLRIEESGANRDAGLPDTISDTRSMNGFWWGNGDGGGFQGGF